MNIYQLNNSYQNDESGFTLLEILVTVLILAVGGLGIASLQLAGLKYTSGSYARTQAIILADDMANRIKTNRAYALNLQAGGTFGANSPYVVANYGDAVASTQDCSAAACTVDELATYDLNNWLNEVARVLPSGQGRVTILDRVTPDGINERQFNIGVQWRQVANSVNQIGNEDDEVKSFTFRISI